MNAERQHQIRLVDWVARLFSQVLDVPLPESAHQPVVNPYPIAEGSIAEIKQLLAEGYHFDQVQLLLPAPWIVNVNADVDRMEPPAPPVTMTNLLRDFPIARLVYMQYATRAVQHAIAGLPVLVDGQPVYNEERQLSAALDVLTAGVVREAIARMPNWDQITTHANPEAPAADSIYDPHLDAADPPIRGTHIRHRGVSFDEAQHDEAREASRLPRTVSWWATPSPVRPQAAVDLGVSGQPGIRGAPGTPGEGFAGAGGLAGSAAVPPESRYHASLHWAHPVHLSLYEHHRRAMQRRPPAEPYVAPANLLDRVVGMEWEVQLSIPSLKAKPISVHPTGSYAPSLYEHNDYYSLFVPIRILDPIFIYVFPDLHVGNLEIRSAPVPLRDFPAECAKSQALLEVLMVYLAKLLDVRIGVFLPQSTHDKDKLVWPLTKHLNISLTKEEVAWQHGVWNNPHDIKDCPRLPGRDRLHCRIPYQTPVTEGLVRMLMDDGWKAHDLAPDPEPYFLGYTSDDAWIPYRHHQLF